MLTPNVRRSRPALALLAGAVVLAACASTALASEASPVVPAGGTVAGEGYAYWLTQKNVQFFDSGGYSTTDAHVCETLSAPGGTVTFLNGGSVGGKITCSSPLGRPVYVDGVGQECSTIEGDHAGFGTSPDQLELCARSQFASAGLHGTAFVDGVPVGDYSSLLSETPAVAVGIPARNRFGLPATGAVTADYGEGLLLDGLTAGTHTIRIASSGPGFEAVVEYTLIVS
jgi:hypothetical protein